MKVLLDECVDGRLARDIVGHEVRTAREMGWTTIKNGELLALAAKQFDVFITVDRNLSFQQNLPAFDIAVIVMRARARSPERFPPSVSRKSGGLGFRRGSGELSKNSSALSRSAIPATEAFKLSPTWLPIREYDGSTRCRA